jgi:hypothetical protein
VERHYLSFVCRKQIVETGVGTLDLHQLGYMKEIVTHPLRHNKFSPFLEE